MGRATWEGEGAGLHLVRAGDEVSITVSSPPGIEGRQDRLAAKSPALRSPVGRELFLAVAPQDA